jgi:hypothetical protein
LFAKLLAAHRSGDRAAIEAYQRAITALNVIFGIGEEYGLGRHASEMRQPDPLTITSAS